MSEQMCNRPVSWLVLERLILGELDGDLVAQTRAHLDRCSSCASARRQIEADHRELPALVVSVSTAARARPVARRMWAWLTAAVALAVLLVVFLRRPGDSTDVGMSGVKGGHAAIELVRERAGQLLEPTRYRVGDRFKVILSCPPRPSPVEVAVVVYQAGDVSAPLPAQLVECGNGLVLDGSFTIDGGGVATVCVLLRDAQGGARAANGDWPARELPPILGPCLRVEDGTSEPL